MAPDRTHDNEDDQEWLLARERGEPGPTVSDARASHYMQLRTLIKELPALPGGIVGRPDWEQDVLAAIDGEVGSPGNRSEPSPAAMIDRLPPSRPAALQTRRRRAAAATAGFAMLAGVVLVVLQREHGKSPVGATAAEIRPEVTRGMHVERGRLGVEHAVQGRASSTAAFRELHDGDTVMTGDAIRASVTTSTDAYLYLAFCSDRRVQMYPSQRGVRARAGESTLVPEGGGELVLDNRPGSEVLYLIVSQDELSVADPDLAALLAVNSAGTNSIACDASLDTKLSTSAVSPPANVLRGERVARKYRQPASGIAGNSGDRVWYTTDGVGDPGDVVGADANGIAVIRYRFLHVSPAQSDHQ